MSQQLHEEIQAQAEKIARDCDRASIRDSIISAGWYRKNLWLGVASAVLAGIIASLAGADISGMLTDYALKEPIVKIFVALLASSSAILTSVVTLLSPAEKANVYHDYSNRYWALRDRIRKFARIECASDAEIEHLKSQYEKLLEERIDLDRKHPVVPEWVYDVAGMRLRAKERRNRLSEPAPTGAEPVALTGMADTAAS